MIKVLEHGIRKITCPNCKAKLQYEQEDIQFGNRMTYLDNENYDYIVCPDCNSEIILNKKEYERTKELTFLIYDRI